MIKDETGSIKIALFSSLVDEILINTFYDFNKLEIWYVSTHTSAVLENIAFSTKAPLILLMPAKTAPLLKAIV